MALLPFRFLLLQCQFRQIYIKKLHREQTPSHIRVWNGSSNATISVPLDRLLSNKEIKRICFKMYNNENLLKINLFRKVYNIAIQFSLVYKCIFAKKNSSSYIHPPNKPWLKKVFDSVTVLSGDFKWKKALIIISLGI